MKTQLGLFFALTALVFGMTLLVLVLVDGFHVTTLLGVAPPPW